MSDPHSLSAISKIMSNIPKNINMSYPRLEFIDKNAPYYASAYYEKLVDSIVDFEKVLNENEEVGAKLATFGESILIHIEDIGYKNPRLIIFYGKDLNGNNVQLIQHVNQISVLLMAVKRIDPNRPRIGFRLSQEIEKEKESED
ncbi:DUF6173 family protein [Flavobacterium panacagri]|uniref:DUF6173 family protein n=1 Tax=Flavobacterium panacagri TaxID=3034146 RepID=UPI0025A586AE|nr:DUF6173 family protein [Flavobacterium panacagri]